MSLIEFLQNPLAYPEQPRTVSLVQTHISWVFIGDDYVYKVKKPVDFGFLDFTTLAKRKFFTEEELRLNKRFSPDVYVEVVPISERNEAFVIGDDTSVVEYALKMRRISEDHMLYRLLMKGEVGLEDIRRVGRHLARIYQGIESDEKARSFGSVEVISHNITENFDQTVAYIGGPVSRQTFDAIKSWSMGFLEKNSRTFAERVSTGHIKECHGDLHLQHICLDNERISVFDCIEFNERFRYGDVASDVAFLSMDLDYNARKDLSQSFTRAYIEESGDSAMAAVLTFYKIYRAYVRAKVTSFMLDDGGLDETSKAKALLTAKKYFDLAHVYVRHVD
jgi:aminoglycoside phosphotransferase family enzyme